MSKSAKIKLSKSNFYVKNHRNLSLYYTFFPLQATKAQYLVSITIFSLAPALGAGIGTYLSESKNEDKKEIENDLVLQILQGKYSLLFNKRGVSPKIQYCCIFESH